jgi:uncharacterized protein YfdQ (DUF2303 family)
MVDVSDMQAVIDAARDGVKPFEVAPGALFFTKDGLVVDLEKHSVTPHRKRGMTTVFDAASFNMVLADNADAGNTVIYLDRDLTTPRIVAVMNDHGKSGAGWRDFRAEIAFRQTPQWAKWRGIDGKMFSQKEFAEFVEDNLADIATPAGGIMLEIVTYLEATKTVNFKSAVRLSSGAIQFQNAEDIDAKVGTGKIEVPETFSLGLSPFLGLPLYNVPARFRYRLNDGKLTMGLKLQRVEDLMAQVINDVVEKIEKGTNVSVVEGKAPEAVR